MPLSILANFTNYFDQFAILGTVCDEGYIGYNHTCVQLAHLLILKGWKANASLGKFEIRT